MQVMSLSELQVPITLAPLPEAADFPVAPIAPSVLCFLFHSDCCRVGRAAEEVRRAVLLLVLAERNGIA